MAFWVFSAGIIIYFFSFPPREMVFNLSCLLPIVIIMCPLILLQKAEILMGRERDQEWWIGSFGEASFQRMGAVFVAWVASPWSKMNEEEEEGC